MDGVIDNDDSCASMISYVLHMYIYSIVTVVGYEVTVPSFLIRISNEYI